MATTTFGSFLVRYSITTRVTSSEFSTVIFPRNLSRQFHQLGQPVQAGSHGIGIVCHALSTVRDGEGFRYAAAEAMLWKAARRSGRFCMFSHPGERAMVASHEITRKLKQGSPH